MLNGRAATAAWLALAGIVLIAGFIKAPAFPTNDSALFEFYGRHLLQGQRLYIDLWDNKLPSIYWVNELWQKLFGEQFRLHIGAEMVVNTLAVILFAMLLRRHKLSAWPWATFTFAAVLVLPSAEYNYTEFYALPLILTALLFTFDRPFLSGVSLACAATFWIPSLLVGLVVLYPARRLRTLALFVSGVLAFAVAYAMILVVIVAGTGTIAALATTWPAYIKQGYEALGLSRLGFFRSLYDPLIVSGAGFCIMAFLTVIRRPESRTERLAVSWICATLIAAVVPGHPSFHYYIPSVAALMFGIATFAGAPFGGWSAIPRVVTALVTLFFLAGTARSVATQIRAVTDAAGSARRIASCSRDTFGPGAVIYATAYAPELYLAGDAVPGNRYALVDPEMHMTQKTGLPIRPPRVFIGLEETPAPPSYRLRYIARPWLVYTKPRVALRCPQDY